MDARTPVPGDETPQGHLPAVPPRSPLPDGASDESPRSLHGSSSGLAVFLFCDVRGYTDFTRRNGAEAASELVARLVAMTRVVADEHHGTMRGTWGDQVLLEFRSARDGVRAALALRERCLDAILDDPDHPLSVGIGLDAGEASGPTAMASAHALNTGARLCARAAAGEALASREVAHLAGAVTGARYVARRPVALKGVPGRTSVVAIEPTTTDRSRARRLRAATAAAHPQRRRLALATVAGVTAAALLATSGWLLLRDDAPPAVPPGGMALLDATAHIREVAPLGRSPAGAAASHDAVWVVQNQADAVARIDPGTRRITQTVPVGGSPVAVATDGDDVWVVNGDDATVTWVNATTNRAVRTIPVGNLPRAIAYGAGRVWVANEGDGTLTVIDAQTGAVVRTAVEVGGGPAAVSFGAGAVWVANSRDNTIVSVDPATLHVAPGTAVGSGPAAIAVYRGIVWVANSLDQTVSRIVPGSGNGTSTVSVGDGPSTIVGMGGAVWVGNAADGSVTRIDADRGIPTGTVRLDAAPTALAVAAGRLWTATKPFAASSHRGGTLTVAANFVYGVDPQLAPGDPTYLVYNTPARVRRAGGPAFDLVPDLARRLPQSTDGARTWTFSLRQGIHYSDGRLVIPDDFRHGLERLYTASPPGATPGDFDVVLGAAQCRATYPVCRLDEGVTTSGDTVTYHLTRPDPDFLHKLTEPFTAPVPSGWSAHPKGSWRVPGTGPYMASEIGPGLNDRKRVVLVRNPHFRQWSFAATPDGYPDVIEFTGGSIRLDLTTIGQVTADVTDVRGSPLLPLLNTRYQDRIQHDPVLGTHFVALNASIWPFDRLKARQAVALALDRAFVARYFGDTRTACQLAPPNLPGHQERCPHTRDPSEHDDQWHGPDIQRARALVRSSGTRGAKVRISVTSVQGAPALAAGLVRMLRSIGYVGRLQSPLNPYAGDPVEPTQLTVDGWSIDYFTPSAMYAGTLSCASTWNPTRHCSPALDRIMDAALNAQNVDPARSRALWAELNGRVTDDASLIPVSYWDRDTFISKRVGNYQDNGIWGPLYEQMWVR